MNSVVKNRLLSAPAWRPCLAGLIVLVAAGTVGPASGRLLAREEPAPAVRGPLPAGLNWVPPASSPSRWPTSGPTRPSRTRSSKSKR
jgi:hypothetical protein